MVRSRQARGGRREPGRAVARPPALRSRRRTAAAVLGRLLATLRPPRSLGGSRPARLQEPEPGRRARPDGTRASGRERRNRLAAAAGLALVVAAAGLLRFWALAGAPVNPFYDAAVRSMGLSWHNFFFGALEPGARIAVDKPPVDLWLQVASTKLIGFNTTALLLPEALGGTAAVALLYAAIRPVFGRPTALLCGLALAVLPISVVTSRSDTMDSVMMALIAAALWATVRALLTGHLRWVVVAATLVGLAFNVKLSEALIPLPALALMWWAVARGPRRLLVAAAGTVALVAVGMLWVVVASLTPAKERPFPIGSRDGSIYQAVFVYNGIDRVNGTSAQVAPIGSASPSGPTRLLASEHPFYGPRLGLELIAALALGLACGLLRLRGLLAGRARRRRSRAGRRERPAAASRAPPAASRRGTAGAARAARQAAPSPPQDPEMAAASRPLRRRAPAAARPTRAGKQRPPEPRRLLSGDTSALPPPSGAAAATAAAGTPGEAHARRWVVFGLFAWLVIASVLFSGVRDLQPRYLEAVSPAVAAALGIGGSALMRRRRDRPTALLLALALAASAAFAVTVGSVPGDALTVCLAAGGLALAVLLAGVLRPPGRLRPALGALLGLACAAALLAAPVGVSIDLVDTNATAAGQMGSGAEFSDYLRAHRHGAYYEVASASVYPVTTLIVRDAQPVLVLSDFHGQIVTLGKLIQLVGLRAVRHIIITHACGSGSHCPPTTRWSLEHAREVVRGGLYAYILPLTHTRSPCSAAAGTTIDRPSTACRLLLAHQPPPPAAPVRRARPRTPGPAPARRQAGAHRATTR